MSSLNGKLKLENLKGDLWNHLTVLDLNIISGDTLIHADTLQLSYNLFDLVRSPHTVENIYVSGMNAKFVQEADSSWNLGHLVKSSGSDTSASPLYFAVGDLQIRHSRFQIKSGYYIPDTTLQIHDFSLKSSFSLEQQGYSANLEHLSFKAENSKLDSPISFETKASASDNEYNLEKLVLATGRSMIRMNGHFSPDTTQTQFSFDFLGNPISWRDVHAVSEIYPVRNDMHIQLAIRGDYKKTSVQLTAESPDLRKLELKANLAIKPEPALTGLNLDIEQARLSKMMRDTLYPDIGKVQAHFDGKIPLKDYQKSILDGNVMLNNLSFGSYYLSQARMNFNVNPDSVKADFIAMRNREKFVANMNIKRPWIDRPEWNVSYILSNINPAVWLADTLQHGDISISGNLQGDGLRPGKTPWNLKVKLLKSRYLNQTISGGHLLATVTDSLIKGNARLNFIHSAVSANISSHWSEKEPDYSFRVYTRHFNLAEISGLKKFPTSLNLNLQGDGKNFNLKKLVLAARLNADSSIVNGERLDTLSAYLKIKNSVFSVDKAMLSSTIADGRFSARQDLEHFDNPSNRLQYDLTLKDLSSLAPLFGVARLQTKGDMMGDLQLKNNNLEFVAEMYLHDIRYDTVTVNKVNGQGVVTLTKEPSYKAFLELQNPSVGNIHLQDFKVNTTGGIRDSVISGEYALDLNIHGKAGSTQHGKYYISKDSTLMDIDQFVCNTSLRSLTMNRPTYVRYVNQTLSTDTLQLQAQDGAFFRMKIDRLSQKEQKGFVGAKNLNVGGVLEIFLLHPEYSGLISGHLNFDVDNKKVVLDSHVSISNMAYHNLKLDSLRLSMNIDRGQLLADGFIENKGQKIIIGEADVPFRLGNPAKFDTTFYEKPVSGFFKMEPLDLSKYQDFLKEFGFEGLTGVLQFNGTLSGNAGLPDIRGEMTLTGSKFSDVQIDTVNLGFKYRQSQKQLDFNSRIISLKQTAARINGSVPFSLDLKQFAVNLPSSKDSIKANIYTNGFNLSALNEFMSPETVKDLKGTLNANVNVEGTIGAPYLEGSMKLENGGIKVIPANIQLKNISMNTAFEPHKINIKELNASSNGGNFTASGNIDLKGYESSSFGLTFKANKFRVMNARNYKAVISMNTKLEGTVTHPVLNGDLTVDNGVVYLDNFGSKSVEEIQLKKTKPNPISGIALYDSLKMDVKLNINRNFWLRNRTSPEMALELNGNVEATKNPRDSLQIFGEFGTNQGYATQFGKRFDLQTGKVTFSGDPTNPALDIKSLYKLRQPNDISIYYMITGTVQNPIFNYSSDPSMDLKNIISYTLFGRPFNALLSWEQTVSGSSSTSEAAKSALMNLLLDRVENLATERLGIDVIQIDNSGQSTGNGTTIKIGKYITDRIFLAVLQQLGGSNQSSQVILEYYLYKNLGLILTQSEGQDSKTGIDVLWHYDY